LGWFRLQWEKEKKYGNGGDGWPTVGGGRAKVPAVSGGGDGSDWWRWGLDIREFGWWDLREKGGKLYGGGGENGEKGEKR
jgi:hypothetical protein